MCPQDVMFSLSSITIFLATVLTVGILWFREKGKVLDLKKELEQSQRDAAQWRQRAIAAEGMLHDQDFSQDSAP